MSILQKPSNKPDRKEDPMLEHPEIGWIERTGYPSWMQEDRRNLACEEEEEETCQDRFPNGN